MTRSPEVTRVGKPRAEARLLMDAHGQIREANDAAHRLLQYDAGTLVGLSLAWIMPPSRHTLLRELIQALKEGARRSLPGVLMREDSSLVLVVVTTNPCLGPRGPELALGLEPDEQAMSAIQRVELNDMQVAPSAAAIARPSSRAQPKPAPGASGPRSPARPTRLSARPPTLQARHPARAREPRSETLPLDVPEQLAACTDLLRWLDGQFQQSGARESPRDRALARIVLQEASQLIELCQRALRSQAPPGPR